jgi:hypothetical protein
VNYNDGRAARSRDQDGFGLAQQGKVASLEIGDVRCQFHAFTVLSFRALRPMTPDAVVDGPFG